ncbi:MAG: hypothetical protein Q4A29_03445 [Eubacteriales bacterium]|nr:hypothetical protein [Eubacteriales bacterium]
MEMELRNDDVAIALLEDFISRYKGDLGDVEKARIATNLGFCLEYDEKGLEYLLEAEKLGSPYVETYKGLALQYFSNFQSDKLLEDLQKSLEAFQKGLKLGDNYEMELGYGICLFAAEKYGKAKEVFESLLSACPNRMRLLLGIAYCEVYLGNKEKVLFFFKQVSVGQDCNYSLNTDEIDELEKIDANYMLEEYDLFLSEANKVISAYYFADWDYYFYTLWIKNQQEKFDLYIEKYKKELLDWIEETKLDEDFSNEAERED